MNLPPLHRTFPLLLLAIACLSLGTRTLPQTATPSAALGPGSSDSETVPLFSVREDGKFGYIDKTGKLVIPPMYDEAYDFNEGLAKVEIGGKAGFIDTTGKVVIPPQYDRVTTPWSFSEGLIGITVGIVLVLLAFVLLSDFPGPSHGSTDKTEAPSEDVSRAQ